MYHIILSRHKGCENTWKTAAEQHDYHGDSP